MAARTRLIALGDTHGDMLDKRAWARAMEFIRDFKPDIRIHLGDAFDLRWLRRAADRDEKEQRIDEDMDAGIALLAEYKPHYWIWGNHEDRLERTLHCSVGHLRELAGRIHQDMLAAAGDAKIFTYSRTNKGILRLAKWKFIHACARGINATRDLAMRYGDVIHGHTHRLERITAPTWPPSTGIAAGTLAKLEMDYDKANLGANAHVHGLVYGEIVGGRLQPQLLAL